MQNKRLLIAGIDPGVTTAYAILDIEGNLICLKSKKEFGLNSIISEITNLGKVVLVGTDKEKVPSLVESFSIKTGAKVLRPNQDLKVIEKRDFIKNYATTDEHQGDALASALYAFQRTRPLMKKIDSIARDKNKSNLKSGIKEIVLTKNKSIHEAINILETIPDTHNKNTISEKIIEKNEPKKEDLSNAIERLRVLNRDNIRLKRYNEALEQQLLNLQQQLRNQKLQEQNFINSKVETLFNYRERRFKNYESLMKSKESTIISLKEYVKELITAITSIKNFYVLKKLNNLGHSYFEAKRILLNIEKGDILLVDEPSIISKDAISNLVGKVMIIIHNKPISRKLESMLPFIFISSENLELKDFGIVALADKKSLDEEKKKQDILPKIVENYRKEKLLT